MIPHAILTITPHDSANRWTRQKPDAITCLAFLFLDTGHHSESGYKFINMALREGTYPPAPFLRGKGSKAPLMASRSGCSDGVLRGHKAIKYPSSIPSQNRSPFPLPRRHRRSLQRSEAKRVTGVRGVGPDKERLFQFLKPRAYSAIGLDFLDKPLKPVALLVNVNRTY